jgi:glycosyltransferase involved in cell wall biosynthesis
MKILHVAPLNVAGVPFSMMEMQRRSGFEARLVTLHQSDYAFPEDICLRIPLPRHRLARWWRKSKQRQLTSNFRESYESDARLPIHGPKNLFERAYFALDDSRREAIVRRAIEDHHLDDFEIIHYDGGLDFFRDCRLAKQWKNMGKKIICHYMGSDLRVRGVNPTMDRLSDLNLTNESDHLLLHHNIHYIYIPFDAASLSLRTEENRRLRIVHSPTNRAMKGTEFILPVVEAVRKERDVEFVLVENKPHEEVIRIKQTCDLAIEQIGNLGGTGYGRNSLETLAMGIPTITEMTPDYTAWLPENPFVLATRETLYESLLGLIDNAVLRKELKERGRQWVMKYHSYRAVHQRLMDLYREHHII